MDNTIQYDSNKQACEINLINLTIRQTSIKYVHYFSKYNVPNMNNFSGSWECLMTVGSDITESCSRKDTSITERSSD